MKKNIFKRTRVVMTTMGSLGDLHPYIGLALEMKKRLLLVPVIYAIFVLDLKLVKWEKVEHAPATTHEPAVAS
jgi:hypothetical protein